MKFFLSLLLCLFTCCAFSQSPVFEGTYFPVKGTSVKQVWDITPGSMSVPTTGPNQVWDYRFSNNQFTNAVDTYQVRMFDPASTPYGQYFPNATHATFLRTPLHNVADSLFAYFQITPNGFYNLGGFNIQKMYDSTMINNPLEFYAPSLIPYLYSHKDTSKYIGYAKNISGYAAKIRSTKYKDLDAIGYGTLMLPNGTYNNVIQMRDHIAIIDSIYIDVFSNGNYMYYTRQTSTTNVYEFYRNNTFASSYLMYLAANTSNTQVSYGWYTLPVDFGSITGSVFTNTTETVPVTNGEAYLYRENSNFAKNDILAKSVLDINGNYHFDSIPYGEYRIAIRPDNIAYPNTMITYFGDTTNWIAATSIITTTITSPGHKIHMQHHITPTGSGNITGQINSNLSIMRTAQVNPIPGVGIVVKKNPGGGASRNVVTDLNGSFTLGTMDNGTYELFVDIPGLYMTGTYSFTIANGNLVSALDYVVGTDSIHPVNSVYTGIAQSSQQAEFMTCYPNPYKSVTNINVSIPETDNVLLEVYNMMGEKVQTLENSSKQAGNYKYSFSAKSMNYSSGMYFIRLSVGNKTSTLKIVEQ